MFVFLPYVEFELRLPPDLPSATMRRPSPRGCARCGFPPISHRLQFDHVFNAERPGLRLPPDLPSATISAPRPSPGEKVAASPRSPIGYNVRVLTLRRIRVAASPRSPIGYNVRVLTLRRIRVAASPRSPIGYNVRVLTLRRIRVAASPRSPIGYNMSSRIMPPQLVAASPRSPIGYNTSSRWLVRRQGCGFPPISHRLQYARYQVVERAVVAASPRSPIGYNVKMAAREAIALRLPPDLPSATMSRRRPAKPSRCGFPRSPIGYNTGRDALHLHATLRLPPDLPSATMIPMPLALRSALRLPPDLPSATIEAASGQLGVRFGPASAGPRENDLGKGLRTGRTALDSCWAADALVRRS